MKIVHVEMAGGFQHLSKINGCSSITPINQLVAHEHICTHYKAPVMTTPKAARKVPAPLKGARGSGLDKTPIGCITGSPYAISLFVKFLNKIYLYISTYYLIYACTEFTIIF